MKKIDGIDVEDQNLDNIEFRPGLEISEHTFNGKSLKNAIFNGVIFDNVTFQDSDIRGASFQDATLQNVTFNRVDLGVKLSLIFWLTGLCFLLAFLAGAISAYSIDFLINLILYEPALNFPNAVSIFVLFTLGATVLLMEKEGLKVWFASILLCLILLLFWIPVLGNNSEQHIAIGFTSVMALACYVAAIASVLTQAQSVYLAHELIKLSIDTPKKKNTRLDKLDLRLVCLDVFALASGFCAVFFQSDYFRSSIPWSFSIAALLIFSGHRIGYLARYEKKHLIDNQYHKILQQLKDLSRKDEQPVSVSYHSLGDKYVALRFIVDAFLRRHQTSFRGIHISENLYLDSYKTDFDKADFYPSTITASFRENFNNNKDRINQKLDNLRVLGREDTASAISNSSSGASAQELITTLVVNNYYDNSDTVNVNDSNVTGGVNPRGISRSVGNFENILQKEQDTDSKEDVN
ncbi:MAG: pentapeptide repeat-containing protein [Leptolyngbyaceae cyanobacterium]